MAKVIKLDDHRPKKPASSGPRNIAQMLLIDEASDVPDKVWGAAATLVAMPMPGPWSLTVHGDCLFAISQEHGLYYLTDIEGATSWTKVEPKFD